MLPTDGLRSLEASKRETNLALQAIYDTMQNLVSRNRASYLPISV